MMLLDYKEKFIHSKTQAVLIDSNALILESDNSLFKLVSGEPISNFHPFFIMFPELLRNQDQTHAFSCVHLDYKNREYICDIQLTTFSQNDHALVIIHDLTQEYSEYQQLTQTRNESIIHAELLALKNKQLEEQEAFKNNFIANFSHELRTPLTSIMVFTNLLAKSGLNSQQTEYLNLIKDSSKHLKMMLEDTLNISQIESGNLKLQYKTFNLKGLIDYLQSAYSAKAKTKGLEFDIYYDDRIPDVIEGDHLRLNQILTNLLENAFKFTSSGKTGLKITLNQKRANKANINFEVFDTGVGISETDIKVIFDSFTQLNTETQLQGAGLGLTIVKKLLHLMDSDIRVKSEPGKGSSFSFSINFKYPVTQSQKREVGNTTQKDDTDKDLLDKFSSKKFKLLLVEDDSITQMLVFKVLADTQRFYIDVLSDGSDVIKELTENEYDIVLMDINLPGLKGHEITKMIRELPIKPIKKTPIIGLTANHLPEEIKSYKKNGMNDVITKPFDEQTLIRTLLVNLK